MGVFEMVVAIVFIGTVGKVLQAFAGRGPAPLADGRVRELEAALRASELRLGQTEARVEELGEKLEFVETLLAAPGEAPRIARGAPEGMVEGAGNRYPVGSTRTEEPRAT